MVNKMSSTEEYLDRLLAEAIQKNMELQEPADKKAEASLKKEEDLKKRAEEPPVEDRPADKSLVNQPWSDMEDMSVETLLSMTEGAEPEVDEDPNHMMTPDEIAALLGAQEDGESAEAEET
ncbi:MAG: hypothetical protein K2J95_07865, partial [Lachnospiraceae bacterium]|nr:hypothetical protein [Lachnospiraceae bacterium]